MLFESHFASWADYEHISWPQRPCSVRQPSAFTQFEREWGCRWAGLAAKWGLLLQGLVIGGSALLQRVAFTEGRTNSNVECIGWMHICHRSVIRSLRDCKASYAGFSQWGWMREQHFLSADLWAFRLKPRIRSFHLWRELKFTQRHYYVLRNDLNKLKSTKILKVRL